LTNSGYVHALLIAHDDGQIIFTTNAGDSDLDELYRIARLISEGAVLPLEADR